VRGDVEQPVTDHHCDDRRRLEAATAMQQSDQHREQHAPRDQGDEAVRPGIGDEAERIDRGGAGHDLELLHAGEDQIRPEEIGKLRRGEEETQRECRRRPLRSEPDGEVSEEHAADSRPFGACDGRAGVLG
jgi:hypothetical protein